MKSNLKNEEPLVSVLLSIYNVEPYLRECLDSLIIQSYHNLEIVCVDNGSTDGCSHILQEYANKDSRIKLVSLEKNVFLCGGRNAGLDAATGDFLCFVDPDDVVDVDHIKVMVEAIQTKVDSQGKPYNLVLNTNAYNFSITENGEKQILFNFVLPEREVSIDDVNHDITIETNIPMWCRLYRKSFLDKHPVRFLEGMNTDNIPYTFKLLAHMERYYIISYRPNATYWRRLITPDGAITPVVLYKNLDIPRTLDDLYDYLKEHGLTKVMRVPYHLLFTHCFPRHENAPEYYNSYRQLMIKMREDIQFNSPVYQKCDKDLCSLLLYASDFFKFHELYFRPCVPPVIPSVKKCFTFKLLNLIPLFKKVVFNEKKVKYYLLGCPVLKTKLKGDVTIMYLFGFIPLCGISFR